MIWRIFLARRTKNFTTHRPESEEAAVASASTTAQRKFSWILYKIRLVLKLFLLTACTGSNHHLSNMAFMMKKKRYKFHVDISELELSEVSYSKAILFAKVRQLDGGNFSDVSKRMEVQNHRVQYNARFQVFNLPKGQIISKGLFGRIRGDQKSFRNYLTFTYRTRAIISRSLYIS